MTRAVLMSATAALAFVTSGAVLAQSESDEPPAVEARHHHMNLYAYNLGILGGMAKGETDYDADMATGAAANIAALSQLNQASYWVEGTSSEDVEASKALPALFENPDDYAALTDDLTEAAMAMQAAAGESAEAIGGQMQALGGACGACHRKYRERDD